MKKRMLQLFLCAVIISSSATAQFQKGDKVLGFGINFSSSKSEQTGNINAQTTKSNSFGASVELGFASGEHRLHGFFINGGTGSNRTEYPSQPGANLKSDNYNIGAGYFARIYKPLGKSFFVFGDARAGFGYSEQKSGINTINKQKNYNISAGVFPGVAFKWNNRFLLELRTGDLISLTYNHSEAKTTNSNAKSTSNNFGLNSSLGLGYLQNFGIGARWILGQNKKA